jgi:hypothetical protein
MRSDRQPQRMRVVDWTVSSWPSAAARGELLEQVIAVLQ